MNPFLRHPSAYQRTPLRAERPDPKQSDDGVATLRLYDPIDSWGGEWGVSAKEFVKTLDELPADTKEIRLLISSPGGEVWEGLAVLNALRAHPAKVIAVVEGIAASSASFIAAGVDELHMMPNAEIFIHSAWGGCLGNSRDMDKMSADLEHEDRNLASVYADKAGGDIDSWLTAMADETFYSAEEAVEAGLADKVVKRTRGKEDASTAKARFDLSVFAKHDAARSVSNRLAPQPDADTEELTADPTVEGADHPAPEVPTEAPEPVSPELPAAEPEHVINPDPKEEDPVSTTDLSEFRSRLGLSDDADEAAILAAVDALKAQAETPTPDPAAEAEAEAAKAENADLRTEVEKLGAMVESMSAKLADTEALNAAKVKASVLDEAQKLGKFKPANRAQWEADYDEAPAVTTRLLARIQPGAEVPVNATGVAGPAEPEVDDEFEAMMARLDGPTGKAV